MKNVAKLLPIVSISSFLLLIVLAQVTDWSFITLLPYFLLGLSLTVASFSLSVASGKLLIAINWIIWCAALLLHLLVISESVEIRSVWEILVLLGLGNIFLYLFALTNRSMVFGKRTFYIAAIPTVTGIFFTLLFVLVQNFLGLAFLCLLIGALFALSGLLFGFRKAR